MYIILILSYLSSVSEIKNPFVFRMDFLLLCKFLLPVKTVPAESESLVSSSLSYMKIILLSQTACL